MSDCKIEHLWVGNNWLRSYLVLSDHRHLDDSDSDILWINGLNDRWVPKASIVKLRTINHNAEYQLFAGSHESMSAHWDFLGIPSIFLRFSYDLLWKYDFPGPPRTSYEARKTHTLRTQGHDTCRRSLSFWAQSGLVQGWLWGSQNDFNRVMSARQKLKLKLKLCYNKLKRNYFSILGFSIWSS